MLTFQLPEETVETIIEKLDQVAGTRQICNFFEGGLMKAKMAQQAQAQAEAQKDAKAPADKKEEAPGDEVETPKPEKEEEAPENEK